MGSSLGIHFPDSHGAKDFGFLDGVGASGLGFLDGFYCFGIISAKNHAYMPN